MKLAEAVSYIEDIRNEEPRGLYITALTYALDAIEKQIPYKPTKCNVTLGRCRCGVGFMDKSTNYCGNCGKKLDWSE